MPRQAKGPRLYYREDKGVWYIRDGAVRRSTGCSEGSREGAEKALAAYIAEKYEPPGKGDTVLIADILTAYARDKAPHHRSKSASYAIERLTDWWGARPVTDIKTSTCRSYIADRMAQPIRVYKDKTKLVAESTAAHDLSVLRAALNHWHAENPLPALPVVTVPPTPPGRDRWLTRSEVARLLWQAHRSKDAGARHALVRFILIGVYTGSRSGVIKTMGWMPNTIGGWFDLDNMIMHRARKDEAVTKKRKPDCRIPDKLAPWLRRWRTADAKIGRTLVISYRGGLVRDQRRAWDAARRRAGLGRDVIPHILRHTAVTWLLQAGVAPWDVGGFIGMSEGIVASTYGHHSPDHQADVAAATMRKAVR